MCCEDSQRCRVFRFIMYVIVTVFGISYLAVVSTIALKYGPSSRPLDIHTSQMAVELDLTDDAHPDLSFQNMSNIFRFTNRKEDLNISIWFVEALILYRGIPVKCMLGHQKLKLNGRSEGAWQMKEVFCNRRAKQHELPSFPFGKEMLSDARTMGRVQFGVTVSVHVVYTHRPLGYWEALYRPACSPLVLNVLNNRGEEEVSGDISSHYNGAQEKDLFIGVGSLSCNIQDPLWVK